MDSWSISTIQVKLILQYYNYVFDGYLDFEFGFYTKHYVHIMLAEFSGLYTLSQHVLQLIIATVRRSQRPWIYALEDRNGCFRQ